MKIKDFLYYRAVNGGNSGGGGGGGGSDDFPLAAAMFYDYDGAVITSYTKQEFAALDALPDIPGHNGLTAKGWNWTLADAKKQVSENGHCDIGAIYEKTDGATEVTIYLEKPFLSPWVCISPKGTVSIDWGDGSDPSSVTGTSDSSTRDVQHTYAAGGEYTIKIQPENDAIYGIAGSSNYAKLVYNKNNTSDKTYQYSVRKVILGGGITETNYAFAYMRNLETVLIPTGVTYFGDGIFKYCISLRHVNVPKGMTYKGNGGGFQNAEMLRTISTPVDFKVNLNNMFPSCYRLRRVTIPYDATAIGASCFNYNTSQFEMVFPKDISSLGGASLTTDNSVILHFRATVPPTITSSFFSTIGAETVIYVPADSVDDYKGATGWSSVAAKIQAEP